ncbi:hypothetical protein HDV05_000536 [Chytridiales sp. JEL 0842]|nr:hypothetical protein HDV05_000536 [Chytridiales sp. JEL 0842]
MLDFVKRPRPSLNGSVSQDLLSRFNLQHHYFHFHKSSSEPISSSSSSYLTHAQDLAGKNECLIEKTLRDAIMAPPRGDPLHISKFEKDVLASAFTLKPGALPGFNIGDLGPEINPIAKAGTTDTNTLPTSLPKPIIKIRFGSDLKLNDDSKAEGEKKKKKKKRKHETEDTSIDSSKKSKKKHG